LTLSLQSALCCLINYILILYILTNFIYRFYRFLHYSVKPDYNIILSALRATFLTPSCRNVAQSARLADLPGSFTYFNEMSSAIRQRHMAHVFNYLLSESTFAFEVPRGRMRVVSEDGNTFVCLIFCGHILHAILKYIMRMKQKLRWITKESKK